MLGAAGLEVLLPWGTAEEHARSNALAQGHANAIVPAHQPLNLLAATLRAAEIAIGVDTGLVHLAAALGTPTVALFTETDPARAGVAIAGPHARDLGGNGSVPTPDTVRGSCGHSPARHTAMLMRRVYTGLWYAALPWLPLRLWWRGRKEPGYRAHVGERFGRFAGAVHAPVLWVHAVSLGETNAARPLLQRLRSAYPDATLLLTHMTATGREAGRAIGVDGVVQAWLPYDVPVLARRFLDHFRPAAGMLLETELWPNIIGEARRAGIPMFLVNARLSERSARRYRRVGSFAAATFGALAGIAAQTADDARRIASLGGRAPVVTGNLKFDVHLPTPGTTTGAALRARIGARSAWLAASTREGEEALLLDAWLPRRGGEVLLIVPRHPQRFDDVARLLQARGVPFARRSDDTPWPADIAVLLGDSMGEMAAYCSAADAVFVGGSLLPLGGQNLIEPIALGRATVVGPHMFNFAAATAAAIAAGAAMQARDAREAVDGVQRLLADAARREAMERAALAFHAQHRGAVDRLWQWLGPQLDAALRAGATTRAAAPVSPPAGG